MPIYDLFDQLERKSKAQDATISHLDLLRASKSQQSNAKEAEVESPDVKNRLFAAVAARLFFSVLILVDFLWGRLDNRAFFCELNFEYMCWI